MVEINPARGTSYRRILIGIPEAEKLFLPVVELSDWSEDPAYALGGLDLETLVRERTRIAEVDGR